MPTEAPPIIGPDYERPPVIETVLGVQFDRLPALSNAYLGLFWNRLDREAWPTVEDAALLPNQRERFGGGARWGAGLQVQLTDDPASRCRIKNRVGDRLIQLQNTRLHLNWIGAKESQYPRHRVMVQEFEETYRRLDRFVTEEGIGGLKPNQWEVTYVNHIPQGSVWRTPADWGFFRLLGDFNTASLVRAESFHGEWHWVIPEDRGRLHVEWQHAKHPSSGSEPAEFIRLVLTARGPLEVSSDPLVALIAGLNFGRDVIVTTFRDLLSTEANDYWGLKHGE